MCLSSKQTPYVTSPVLIVLPPPHSQDFVIRKHFIFASRAKNTVAGIVSTGSFTRVLHIILPKPRCRYISRRRHRGIYGCLCGRNQRRSRRRRRRRRSRHCHTWWGESSRGIIRYTPLVDGEEKDDDDFSDKKRRRTNGTDDDKEFCEDDEDERTNDNGNANNNPSSSPSSSIFPVRIVAAVATASLPSSRYGRNVTEGFSIFSSGGGVSGAREGGGDGCEDGIPWSELFSHHDDAIERRHSSRAAPPRSDHHPATALEVVCDVVADFALHPAKAPAKMVEGRYRKGVSRDRLVGAMSLFVRIWTESRVSGSGGRIGKRNYLVDEYEDEEEVWQWRQWFTNDGVNGDEQERRKQMDKTKQTTFLERNYYCF